MLYDYSVSDRGSHRPWKTANLTEIRTETVSLVVRLVHSAMQVKSAHSGDYFQLLFHWHEQKRSFEMDRSISAGNWRVISIKYDLWYCISDEFELEIDKDGNQRFQEKKLPYFRCCCCRPSTSYCCVLSGRMVKEAPPAPLLSAFRIL